jgi:hypothetical protein
VNLFHKFTWTFLLGASLASSSAYAWPPQLAQELEFEHSSISRAWTKQVDGDETANPASLKMQEKFKNLVMEKCPECEVTAYFDKYSERKYRITLPENWYFEITMDPGVIEITGQPTDKLSVLAPKIQNLIWNTAEELGMTLGSAGHLNFGVESTFGNDSRLFRNFYVDYLNNVGLSSGVIGGSDPYNAPHPERLNQKQRRKLRKILDEFNPKKSTIQSFSKNIIKNVYYKSTAYGGADGEAAEKYHAANLTSAADKNNPWPRFEIRAMPMQKSAEDLELLYDLFSARVKYLKKNEGLVPYTAHLTFEKRTPASMVEEFYRYVTESGLDWNIYKRFVSKREHYQVALRKFERKRNAREARAARARAICPTEFAKLK